jgi:hypothetical protein
MRLHIHLYLFYLIPVKDDDYELDIGYRFLCFTLWVNRNSKTKIRKL